jgi:hypothetical protein
MKYAYLISILLFISACSPDFQNIVVNGSNQVDGVAHNIDKNADCKWQMQGDIALPDPKCSPGDAFPLGIILVNGKYLSESRAYIGDICVPGYSKNIRSVSDSTKNAVYKSYGVISRVSGEYEMDHIIPLELGGTNEKINLFPQPADPSPGFHEKDRCENCLHKLVCDGKLDVIEAQNMMAKDWTQCLTICK